MYIRWYAEGDVDGAAEVCVVPFVVVRDGVEIRLPDHDAMREHLAAVMEGFRTSGVARWERIETDLNELGDRTIFATVRWHGLDAEDELVREISTTYHIDRRPDGFRFVSYTNHFTSAPGQ